MKKRANRASEPDEPLCCCEYVDRHGSRGHVAACCCDCEDLDEACDRWLKDEPQRTDSLSRLVAVVSDRLRVPWLWGGARRVDLSVLPPLLLLPVLLHVATLHFLLGIVVLTALPGLVLWYYYVTHRKKGRTLFFLSLALFSLGYMYYLFVTEIFLLGGVGLSQLCAVTGGLVLTMAALVRTKRGPGYVWPRSASVRGTVANRGPPPGPAPPHNGPWPEAMANRGGGSEQRGLGAEQRESGRSRAWCPTCQVERPPRAAHCRICGVCVLRLDHHCVWINSCVGLANHRSFLLTLLLFLMTSLYGTSLVLSSACPDQNRLTALLYCPGVYNRFSSALCFTCAWYCSIVTGGLLHLLAMQLINISYNVTEREARLALREEASSPVCWGLVVDTGVYSRGFRGNWAEFLTMGRSLANGSPRLTDVV